LQQIVEVDPLLACPRCHGVMRLVACITPRSVIDQILAHRRARVAREPRAGRAAARRLALVWSAIVPYVRRILHRARLNFLS